MFLLYSCRSEELKFSEIPALKLEMNPEQYKLNGKDSLVRITLNYTDGDGDIGLNFSDTFPPFNFGGPFFYNLFVYVYSVENGIEKPILIPLSTDSVHYNDRIANLTPSGKNKAITGKLTINLKAEPYPGIQPDSMFYSIQIADRKLHLSNKVYTPVMEFKY